MASLIHIPLLGGVSALILLSLVHYASAESEGSDFSNNLFSDIAPLLALFGEKFAQQFMSESFGWLDHVVFAMAPLGIITAVVGAIRVGGPSWMRAIIGRARENRASAEVELMSSTSHEVCELWNGESVVRTLGRPLVKQIVVLRNEIHDETTFGLFTMEAAAQDRKMEWKVYNGPSISRWLKSYLPSPLTRKRRRNKSSSWAWDTDIESGNHPNLDGTKDLKTKDAAEKGADVKITNGETRKNTSGSGSQKAPTRARRTTKLEEAPNILLNLHHGSNTGDLVFAAIIGCILQLGVLVFSAFVTYHGGLGRKIPEVAERRTNYGYPSLAAGTALLTIGMFIVSSVIEQSTVEEKWRAPYPKSSPGADSISDLQVLWLQKQHVVGDQSFDSYVLQAQELCKEIITSRRSAQLAERVFRDNLPVARNGDSPVKRVFTRLAWTPTEFFTFLGSFIGLAGFILQFQGFRGVHWACALAQLAATGIMTTARAWIRRGLIVRPRADRVISDHEMDWLVKNMALGHTRFWPEDDKSGTSLNKTATKNEEFDKNQPWTITFAYQGCLVGVKPEDFRDRWTKRGQRAVDIRRRLQSLTNWTGPVSDHAGAVAAAIKKVMDTFLKSGRQFVWDLDMPLGGSIYQIRITVDREPSGEANTDGTDENTTNPWKDLSAEIESVLSLWLFDIKSKAADESGDDWQDSQISSLTPGKRNRYILGPNINNSLGWDVSWWISNDIAPDERVEDYDQAIKISEREMVIGYRGKRLQNEDSLRKVPFNETPITTLSVPLPGKTELLLAQHLFSGFMWSVAHHISREELLQPITFDTRDRFDIYDHTTWDFCKIQNSNLNTLIRDVQRTGMGSLEEVSMFIIPALSYAGKLPSESIVELIRQRVRDNEIGHHWEESIQVYSELIQLVKGGITELFLYKAIAAVADFLIIARETEIPDSMIKLLETMKTELFSDTILNKTRSIRDVTLDIRRLYVWQKRAEEYDNTFEAQIKGIATDGSIAQDEEDRLMRLFGYTDCHKALVHDTYLAQDTGNWHSDMLSGDILSWTPLHYAVLRDPGFYAKYAKLLNIRARNEPRDIAERTPLHYAARLGRWGLGRSLSKHSDINAKGRDGMLPIHWAAKCGNLVMTRMLLDNGSHVNVNDNLRRTPLHMAVEHSHEAIVKLLLEAGANVDAIRWDGDSILHRAAIHGHSKIVQLLLTRKVELDVKGRKGETALHHACRAGHEETVRLLLENGAKPSEHDNEKNTPLHEAAEHNHAGIATLLLDNGAEIDARGAASCTPLIGTAWKRSLAVMEVLYQRGADRVAIDRNGYHPILLAAVDPNMMGVVMKYTRDIPDLQEMRDTALGWAREEEVKHNVRLLTQGQEDSDSESIAISPVEEDTGRTPLHNAASAGDIDSVRTLVEGGADPNTLCNHDDSALFLAAWGGKTEVVEFLLAHGADARIKNKSGQAALHKASVMGRTDVVRLLLERGNVDINDTTDDNSGDTALMQAAHRGRKGAVDVLLEHNADVNIVNKGANQTAMILAASGSNTDIILRLLDHGADMLAENNDGWRSIDWAAFNGDATLVQILLSHRLNANGGWQKHFSKVTGRTSLHLAAEEGKHATVEVLLDAGADIDAQVAPVSEESKGSDAEEAQEGDDSRSKKNGRSSYSGDDRDEAGQASELARVGCTALHLAANNGHVKVAEILLERGARIDLVNKKGETAIQVARAGYNQGVGDNSAMVELLLSV